MKTIINLNSKTAESDISIFKTKKYEISIRIENIHLKTLNEVIGFNLFSKNDLYVGGETLWSVMQPKGEDEHHNHHNLSPKDILEAFKSVLKPYCILESEQNRIAIITSFISHLGDPLNIIIELGAGLKGNVDANINKLVTMFPISKISKYIDKYGTDKIYYLRLGNKAKEKA